MRIATLVLVPVLVASIAFAGPPQLVSYEGRLTTRAGASVADGNYDLNVWIFDKDGATIWHETHIGVPVSGGRFGILLGSVKSPSPILGEGLFGDTTRTLGVTIGAGTEQTPRITGEQIKWQVISGGGGRTVSANYVMCATIGQVVAGCCSSVNYRLNAGYWQNFGAGGCCLSLSAEGRTGNVDGDPGKGVDIADLSALIAFLYISFTPPVCMESANIDGDSLGGVDISDLSAIIDFLYISFTPPAVCQ